MEFKSLKNIETSFRQIRLFGIVFLCLCALVSVFSVVASFRFAEKQREKIYVLDGGKSLMLALSQDLSQNRPERLTPRSRKSKWSELNKERVRRLTRLGLMTPHGEKCLPEMDPEAFRIDPDILEALQKDPRVYSNFLAFPRLYRHVRLDTIQIKKNQPELFHSRLEKFLKNTRENRMFGEWHDGGRLLEE